MKPWIDKFGIKIGANCFCDLKIAKRRSNEKNTNMFNVDYSRDNLF